MAVYTHLDELALRALWSAYDDERELVSFEAIPHGSINTTYRLVTEAGVFFLRINEGRAFGDVWYERSLLEALAQAGARGALGGIVTPTIRRNRVGGSFFLVPAAAPSVPLPSPKEPRPSALRRAYGPTGTPSVPPGKWAAIFPELPGRDLDAADVEPGHLAQIGAFLARAHGAVRRFKGGRGNPYGLATVERWLDELLASKANAPTVTATAQRLAAVVARVRAARRPLPRGVVHGDLFIDNTKWRGPDLVAVFDWEMAGRDHLALDVAVCLHAWCWRAPERAFDAARCRALVSSYQAVRPLAPSERRGLFAEALFAAARFTASRVRDFEVPRADGAAATRTYLNHRDFLARLEALESLGEREFRRMVGLA